MSTTINELVALPSLRTRFLAGRSGGERVARWAHTCELPDPWNWLGTGDLLLSDGYNFPAKAEDQVSFLECLAQAALSGLALAEGMHAPALTAEAIAAADALEFPVLETAYAVPFVTVARTVADSNSREASTRLIKIIRLYDILRRAHQAGFRGNALLGQLGNQVGARLYVVDARTGRTQLPSEVPFPATLRQALCDNLQARGEPLPTFIRMSVSAKSILALPIEAGQRALLVVEPLSSSDVPDLLVLQHIATIASLEVERWAVKALRYQETGARLLIQLVDRTADIETAETHLSSMGLGHRPWRLVCLGGDASITTEDVRDHLGVANAPHLVAQPRNDLLLLLSDKHATSELLGHWHDARVRAGVSQPVHSLKGVGDGALQARWAMETAHSEGRSIVVYGDHAPTFMPRTVTEGETVVARVLGPVIAYDAEKDARLVQSLEMFLDNNRSWKEAADRLGIHRQTLIYRMRRVEELTGRKLQNLQDQTDLYLALKTLRMLTSR